jgi:hypothetical protein
MSEANGERAGVRMCIPVTGRCDEVEQDMNTVVAESGVTLDTGLFGENVVVLALEVADDFAEAVNVSAEAIEPSELRAKHLDSLSTWSPNPGVSTTVSEIRVPSSSSSSSADVYEHCGSGDKRGLNIVPTVTGFIWTPPSTCAFAGSSCSTPDRTLLPQSVLTKVVRPGRNWLVDGVDGRLLLRELTSAGCTADHDAKLDTLLDILLAPNLWLCQWAPLDTAETATLSWKRTYVGRHDVLWVEDSAATSA